MGLAIPVRELCSPGARAAFAVVSYVGQMFFGRNADRMAAPDVHKLVEGTERACAELNPPASDKPRPRATPAARSVRTSRRRL